MSLMKLNVRRFDGIAIVPFIDIMLVLVVLTLSLSTFIAQGEIPISLPQAKSQSVEQIKPITITITADKAIYCGQNRVSIEELDKMTATFAKENGVIIKADKHSDFEVFTQVAAILSSHAISKISIATIKN